MRVLGSRAGLTADNSIQPEGAERQQIRSPTRGGESVRLLDGWEHGQTDWMNAEEAV